MRHRPERHTDAADRTVENICRKNRKRYPSEDKVRNVLAGLRGEGRIAELCHQEGIAQSQDYLWSKELMSEAASAGNLHSVERKDGQFSPDPDSNQQFDHTRDHTVGDAQILSHFRTVEATRLISDQAEERQDGTRRYCQGSL